MEVENSPTSTPSAAPAAGTGGGSGGGKGDNAGPEYEEGRITVVVRSRPFNDREYALKSSCCLEVINGQTISIHENGISAAVPQKGRASSEPVASVPADSASGGQEDCSGASSTIRLPHNSGRVHAFTFDHAYDGSIPQERLYMDVGRPVLESSLRGFNTCIFAYGQTGSGKSYAMMGPSGGQDTDKDPGIIPRLCTELFKQIEERMSQNLKQREDATAEGVEDHALPPKLVMHADVSYLEIYQEKVKCLLKPRKENLKVRQHPALGVYVEGLTEVTTENYEDVLQLMYIGNQGRHTAATNMNDRSSRSHAIFAIQLSQKRIGVTKDGEETTTLLRSKVNLVDLAGSERAKSSGAEGETLKEGAQINKSLTVLGLVISGLAETSKVRAGGGGGKLPFIPYRDSMLTFLLKESLGGNSKTFMISTISPATVNYEETLSTLRYADRAKSIVTRACVNESAGDKRIRELEDEVTRLRDKIKHFQDMVQRQEEVASLVPKLNLGPVSSSQPWQREGRIPVGFRSGSSEQSRISGGALNPRTAIDRVAAEQEWDDGNDDNDDGQDGAYATETPRQPQDAARLLEQLRRAEKMITSLSKSDTTREKESAALLEEYKAQSTVKVNRQEPYLLNIDGAGDWVMEYLVDEVTYLGVKEFEHPLVNSRCVIVSGEDISGIGDQHCALVKRADGTVWLRPVGVWDTFLDDDDKPLREETQILSGSTIFIGEDFLQFKFVDPSVSSPATARRRRLQALPSPHSTVRSLALTPSESPVYPMDKRASYPSDGAPTSLTTTTATSNTLASDTSQSLLFADGRPHIPPLSLEARPDIEHASDGDRRIPGNAAPVVIFGQDSSTGHEHSERSRSPPPVDPSASLLLQQLRKSEEMVSEARDQNKALQKEMIPQSTTVVVPALALGSKTAARRLASSDANPMGEDSPWRGEGVPHATAEGLPQGSQSARSVSVGEGSGRRPLMMNLASAGSSTARLGCAGRGVEGSSSVRMSPVKVHRNLKEDYVESYRHAFIFLGRTRSGKTALRANLRKQDKWFSFLSREKLEYHPTFGVDVTRAHTGLVQQAEMPLIELSGNSCFDLLQELLPQSRVTYVLCFSLVEQAALHLFRQTLEAILCQTACRNVTLMLVGTHLDVVRWSDAEVSQILSELEIEINDFLKSLQSNADFRPTIVGRFAVSNVDRTVFAPSAPRLSRFPDMLSWMGEHSVQSCRVDADFPNCLIPCRLITLANKLRELSEAGKWCITSSEYKVIARAIDVRYQGNNEELHRHTQLLHSWGVLHHHYRHLTMRRHIILDMPWVMRSVAALSCCRRTDTEYLPISRTTAAPVTALFTATHVDASDALNDSASEDTPFLNSIGVWRAFSGRLPFSPHAIARADAGSLWIKGILTNATANELFKGILREKRYSVTQLPGLLELLGSYDFIIMGSRVRLSLITSKAPFLSAARGPPISAPAQPLGSAVSVRDPSFHRENAHNQKWGYGDHDDEEEDEDDAEEDDDDDDEDTPESFYLIPSCFRGQAPTAFTLHLPDILFGPFYRFKFNMIPPNFFPRFIARVAYYAEKVFLGPVSQGTVFASLQKQSVTPSSSPSHSTAPPHRSQRAIGNEPRAIADLNAVARGDMGLVGGSFTSMTTSSSIGVTRGAVHRSADAVVADEAEQFWENTAWVISSPTTRALLRMVHHTLLIIFHDHNDDTEFHDGLQHIVHNVIGESPGATCQESLLCTTGFMDDAEKAAVGTLSGRVLEESELYAEHQRRQKMREAGEDDGEREAILYWKPIDDNINSLEKIREMENYALRTARGASNRRYLDALIDSTDDSASDPGLRGNRRSSVGGYDSGSAYAVIPFVRSRDEPIDCNRIISSITAECLLTDAIVHRVERAVKLIAKGRRLGERDRGIMLEGKGIDELVDALANA